MIDWKSIRAAVFDLDGTLIDSARIWQEVDEIFFARRGMAVPDGYAEEIAHLGFAESAALTVQRYFPRENAADIIEEWRELSLSRYKAEEGARYFKPGAVQLVSRMRAAGLRLCVATASSPEFFLPILRAGGVESLFDAFVTVADAGKNKSFPDIFLQSAQRLGVSPAACAVFEDNGRALVAAKQAGMHTCAVYDGQPEAAWSAICADADLVLYDLRRCGPFAAESDETMRP